jgi:hypothetical protein
VPSTSFDEDDADERDRIHSRVRRCKKKKRGSMDLWRLPNPGGACRLGLRVMTSSSRNRVMSSSRNRVTFVSPSPISFCCGLHNVTYFAESSYYRLRRFPQVNGLLLAVPWVFRGGLLLWKACGSNRSFHRPKHVILRPIDDDAFRIINYDCFHLFTVPFKCPLSPATTGEAT